MQQIFYLNQYIKNTKKIQLLLKELKNNLGIKPIIGAEIEFYVTDIKLISILEKTLNLSFKKEKGKLQYEFILNPSRNVIFFLHKVYNSCKDIQKICIFYKERALFSPKPYDLDYGNSIHLHINFLDINNKNIFDNENNLYLSARSLCTFMLETFLVFAFHEIDYKRFDYKFMAPTHVCFGKNNRTVAIRIPDTKPKRLEHRVASLNSNLLLVMYVILKSIYIGLINPQKVEKYEPIYGNAFEQQYNLKQFPSCLKHAIDIFNINFFVNNTY